MYLLFLHFNMDPDQECQHGQRENTDKRVLLNKATNSSLGEAGLYIKEAASRVERIKEQKRWVKKK